MSTTTRTVNFQATPAGAPRTYTFSLLIDGEALNESHGVLEAAWNFGDGSESEELQPTHTFSTSGNYAVSVEVFFAGSGKGDGDESSSSSGDEPPPSGSAMNNIFVE